MSTAKKKVPQDVSLRFTRKTSSSIRSQRCSLYDKYHIKTEYDMNYKFICYYCKNKSHSRYEFKNHKESLHHQVRAKGVHCMTNVTSKQNMTWTTSSFVITAKMKVTRDTSLRITRKVFTINSEPKVFTVWQMSHWNEIWHELQVHVWSLQKWKLLEIWV